MSDSFKRFKRFENNDDSIHEIAIPNKFDIDYSSLALQYPQLQPYISLEDGKIDFTNDTAVRILNQTLMLHWFNIKLELPINHLCPTVLSRTNYIQQIQKLLNMSHISSDRKPILGIDIGTGASCIYPLIGHALFNWNFIASDIDPESLAYASKNILKNNLDSHILLVQPSTPNFSSSQTFTVLADCFDLRPENYKKLGEGKGIYFDSISSTFSSSFEVENQIQLISADFTMCNPPFFSSLEEKIPRNDTVCVATSSELATEGGEVNFVKQMIDESRMFGTRCKWFTTLLGKKSSVSPLYRYLLSFSDIVHIEKLDILQGTNKRWILAWTFNQTIKELILRSKASEEIQLENDEFEENNEEERLPQHISADIVAANSSIVEQLIKKKVVQVLGLNCKHIKDTETNKEYLQVSLYSDASWLVTNLPLLSQNIAYISKKTSDNTLEENTIKKSGPSTRPSLAMVIRFNILPTKSPSIWTVNIEFLKSEMKNMIIEWEGIPVLLPHVFSKLARDLKVKLEE